MCNKIILTVFFLVNLVSAQEKSFPILEPSDIPGGSIERTDYYNGNSLWGLINGGADIYLEYGFDELAFQSVDWMEENFRIEIYKMNNEESAFGIFSVSRFKCDINDTLTKYICITPYQVQAAVGKYYISVANNTGSNEVMQKTIHIFAKIFEKTNEQLIDLPALFDCDYIKPYADKLKLIKGELGLQNGFPMWYDLLAEYSGFRLVVATIDDGDNRTYVSQIKFSDEEVKNKFIGENPPSDKVTIKNISADEIIYVKADSMDTEVENLLGEYN